MPDTTLKTTTNHEFRKYWAKNYQVGRNVNPNKSGKN